MTAATASSKGPKWESNSDNDTIVLLDSKLYPELMDEALAREVINRVQRLRKKAGLVSTDDVRMEYTVLKNPKDVDIKGMISSQGELITTALRGSLDQYNPEEKSSDGLILEETQEVNSITLSLKLLKF